MRTSYCPMIPVISEVSPGLSRPDTFTSTSSLTVCALPMLGLFLGPGRRRNHVNTVYPLQPPGQLVATPATFTQIMFKVRKPQAQLALAGLHLQLFFFTKDGNSHHEFFPILHAGRGNTDYLVALALGQLRQFAEREYQHPAFIGNRRQIQR